MPKSNKPSRRTNTAEANPSALILIILIIPLLLTLMWQVSTFVGRPAESNNESPNTSPTNHVVGSDSESGNHGNDIRFCLGENFWQALNDPPSHVSIEITPQSDQTSRGAADQQHPHPPWEVLSGKTELNFPYEKNVGTSFELRVELSDVVMSIPFRVVANQQDAYELPLRGNWRLKPVNIEIWDRDAETKTGETKTSGLVVGEAVVVVGVEMEKLADVKAKSYLEEIDLPMADGAARNYKIRRLTGSGQKASRCRLLS